MADQVEQRILPKLRGLDVKDFAKPLGDLASLMGDLGDDTLKKAYLPAIHQDRAIFAWAGLDRTEPHG